MSDLSDSRLGLIISITGLAIVIGLAGVGMKLTGVSKRLEELKPTQMYEIQTEDVMGNEIPERFYEINGEKAYVQIDGNPVREYTSQ